MGELKKEKKPILKYICIFCESETPVTDKTEINYKGKWARGCPRCFLSSIEDMEKFNRRQLKINIESVAEDDLYDE